MTSSPTPDPVRPSKGSWVLVAIGWILVGLPLAWGINQTLKSAVVLFR